LVNEFFGFKSFEDYLYVVDNPLLPHLPGAIASATACKHRALVLFRLPDEFTKLFYLYNNLGFPGNGKTTLVMVSVFYFKSFF